MTYFARNLLELFFLLAAAALLQLLWPLLTGSRTGQLTLQRLVCILRRSGLAVITYLLLGASLPHIRTPKLTAEEEAALPKPAAFYGNTHLAQRAALVTENRQALELRLHMIANAKTSIILTTFSFHADDSGSDLLALLLEAADRGVRVEILCDGFDAMTDQSGKEPFSSLAAHPNIHWRVYSPGSFLRPGKAMARMHEKFLIVDGKYLLLGGRNSHDYSLGNYPAKIHNIDLDILITGKGGVIDELTDRHAAMTALQGCVLLSPAAEQEVIEDSYARLRSRAAQLHADHPDLFTPYDFDAITHPCDQITLIASSIEPTRKLPTLWHTLCTLMENAEHEVRIHTPYLICNREMKADLARIADRTDLRITLNAPETSANLFGAGVYLNDKDALMATGAQLMEYHGSHSSHSKAICIDERLAIVGSFNIDMRSAYIDSEVMLAVDSPALARDLKAFMDAVDLYAAPAEAPSDLPTTPKRELLIGLMRLIERPFRHLL